MLADEGEEVKEMTKLEKNRPAKLKSLRSFRALPSRVRTTVYVPCVVAVWPSFVHYGCLEALTCATACSDMLFVMVSAPCLLPTGQGLHNAKQPGCPHQRPEHAEGPGHTSGAHPTN